LVLPCQKVEELSSFNFEDCFCNKDLEHFLDVVELQVEFPGVDDQKLYKIDENFYPLSMLDILIDLRFNLVSD